ncbi:MAG: 1-deoxy-D-xylulose-5-phosphate reductoisomerase, partial [Halieaceae bacterium]|nr:1-deoxy-D-xylulose-5-phosphate reductoisomerase [Halieaceae bacterium]
MATKRLVSILGSTGSIGVSTLDVIARHPDHYEVYALAANTSVDAMLEQCRIFQPRVAVMMGEEAAEMLRAGLPDDCTT